MSRTCDKHYCNHIIQSVRQELDASHRQATSSRPRRCILRLDIGSEPQRIEAERVEITREPIEIGIATRIGCWRWRHRRNDVAKIDDAKSSGLYLSKFMFCERITVLSAVSESLAMSFTLAVLVIILLVADTVLILLVHIDVEFDARLSIKVNSRQTPLRHLSVSISMSYKNYQEHLVWRTGAI